MNFITPTYFDPKAKYCVHCIYHEAIPAISFNNNNLCIYCQQYQAMQKDYPTGNEGQIRLKQLAENIKKKGVGKEYDVIVGVSGGCDSSYLLVLAKQMGLRPLAVHYDNTWNTTIAVENIKAVIDKLGIDLYTHVAHSDEVNDLLKSMMLASVPDIDAPSDLALAALLYATAEKFNVKYIWEGHSFRTEGISPPGWFYMDAKYINSIHQLFSNKQIKSVPQLHMGKWFKWMLWHKIQKQRPLYYVDYNKEDIKEMLRKDFGWQWYGGHHMENRISYFCNNYYLPAKFDIDLRWCEFSALVRSGQMSRKEAIEKIKEPKIFDDNSMIEVLTRLKFNEHDFQYTMKLSRKSYRDYPSYKKTFIRLRPFFFILYKTGYVTRSFYDKFTIEN